jgi:hypothetical protein
MWEGTTLRVMATDRPYGEFYDFYSVSLEYFGYHHVWMSCLISAIYDTPVGIGQGTSVRKDMN